MELTLLRGFARVFVSGRERRLIPTVDLRVNLENRRNALTCYRRFCTLFLTD